MPKGLPKWAIKEARSKGAKNVFAYAWSLVKRKGKKRKSTKTRSSNPNKKRSVRKTGKKKRRRSRSMTIPLAPVAGLAAGVAEPIAYAMKGDVVQAFNHLSRNYTGVDIGSGSFSVDRLKKGLVPLVIGLLVHKFVGGAPLNANKALARANVPFIRI